MAITTSGSISIKEAAGAANSIDTTVTSVSSGSLVALSEGSVNYTDSTRGNTPRDTDASPYGMLEFSGYEHTSTGEWPSFAPAGWGNEYHLTSQMGQDAQAFSSMEVVRDDANSRIKVISYSGTAAAMATVYTNYITYSGLTTPTFAVKYRQTSGTATGNNGTYDNTPAEAGLDPDTWYNLAANGANRQFKWMSNRRGTGYNPPNGLAIVSVTGLYFTFKFETYEDGEYPVWISIELDSDTRALSCMSRRGIEP